MGWVVIFLIVIVFMLWWIRWAIEPARQFFQRRIDESEERAFEARVDDALRDEDATA